MLLIIILIRAMLDSAARCKFTYLCMYVQGGPKKRNPGFNFAITLRKYTSILIIFTVTTRNVWHIKVKLRLPPHLYSVTPYLAKYTLLLISMLHFCTCNVLKFTQNSLVVLIPYLLIYSQQCFVTTLLRHIVFMHNVFCFNGFNQTDRPSLFCPC